jgi:uncharacterized protein YgiM (DUF1202 family)
MQGGEDGLVEGKNSLALSSWSAEVEIKRCSEVRTANINYRIKAKWEVRMSNINYQIKARTLCLSHSIESWSAVLEISDKS